MAGPGLHTIGAEECASVIQALQERQLSRYRFDDEASGNAASFTYRFERALEAELQVRHCLGMNSCTSALLSGMWAAGIGAGDEVIVPGYTFVASMAAVAYTGAQVVLAEIDESLTLDPADVAAKITPRTKAILCVHMLGLPADVERLARLSEERGLILIEDCAQAAGGRFRGRALGSFGLFGAFSLNVFKTFTAGDGGVLLTNSTALFEAAFAIHDHGSRPMRLGVADADSLLGLNFRMHELTGAVAHAQLPKLAGNLQRLRSLKRRLAQAIGPLEGVTAAPLRDTEGECGTVLAFTFVDAAHARRVAQSLGSRLLADSGKHVYANIPQLQRQCLPAAIRGRAVTPEQFRRGALPQTDDLLSRTVALSVGVQDSYLGTSFGINIHADDAEIERAARTFRDAVTNALTRHGRE
jgi:dTDP-4-amino-4,6-dideoxygalactose transaminase